MALFSVADADSREALASATSCANSTTSLKNLSYFGSPTCGRSSWTVTEAEPVDEAVVVVLPSTEAPPHAAVVATRDPYPS
jgi:hypothetical protein